METGAFVGSFVGGGVGARDARFGSAVVCRRSEAAARKSTATVRMGLPLDNGMSNVYKKLMQAQTNARFERQLYTPANKKKAPVGASKPYTERALNLSTGVYFNLQGIAPPKGTSPMKLLQSRNVMFADKYLANSLKQQFKAAAAPAGVYLPQCTEGNVKGAAENARIASLAKDFRKKQRSAATIAFDLFEGRRMAIKAIAHDCEYEEATFRRFTAAGEAFVLGMSEKTRACDRYMPAGSDAAADYMQRSVQRAMKERAMSFGVYSTSCADGTVKGAAEDARVASLAAAFRARQMGTAASTGAMFAARKQARDWFTNGCHYEEGLVAKFPAAAATMRPATNRY
mmetsp:Transcript_14164/g.30500  ORF Transcript_14164/g.30500 Transcript_14164/m.30500 type:complete len:343 (-) Transcript_14164:2537-3565(-)